MVLMRFGQRANSAVWHSTSLHPATSAPDSIPYRQQPFKPLDMHRYQLFSSKSNQGAKTLQPMLRKLIEDNQFSFLNKMGYSSPERYKGQFDLESPMNKRRIRPTESLTVEEKNLTKYYKELLFSCDILDNIWHVDDVLTAPGLLWNNEIFFALLQLSNRTKRRDLLDQTFERMDELGISFDMETTAKLMWGFSDDKLLKRASSFLQITSPEDDFQTAFFSLLKQTQPAKSLRTPERLENVVKPFLVRKSANERIKKTSYEQIFPILFTLATEAKTREFNKIYKTLGESPPESAVMLKCHGHAKNKDLKGIETTINYFLKKSPKARISTAMHNQMILAHTLLGQEKAAIDYYNTNYFVANNATARTILKAFMDKRDIGGFREWLSRFHLTLGISLWTKIQIVIWAVETWPEEQLKKIMGQMFNQDQFTDFVVAQVAQGLENKGLRKKARYWLWWVRFVDMKSQLREANDRKQIAFHPHIDLKEGRFLTEIGRGASSKELLDYFRTRAKEAREKNQEFFLTFTHVSRLLVAFSMEGKMAEVRKCWNWALYHSMVLTEIPHDISHLIKIGRPTPRAPALPANIVSAYVDAIGYHGTFEELETFFNKTLKRIPKRTFFPSVNFYSSYVEALFRKRKFLEAFDLVFGPDGLDASQFTPNTKFVSTFISGCNLTPGRLLEKFKEKWPDAIDYGHPSLRNYSRKWLHNTNTL